MSEHSDIDQHKPELARDNQSGGHGAPPRDPDTASLVTLANIGLVGVPLAYATSKSVVITLIAVALAILAVIAYLLVRRRR